MNMQCAQYPPPFAESKTTTVWMTSPDASSTQTNLARDHSPNTLSTLLAGRRRGGVSGIPINLLFKLERVGLWLWRLFPIRLQDTWLVQFQNANQCLEPNSSSHTSNGEKEVSFHMYTGNNFSFGPKRFSLSVLHYCSIWDPTIRRLTAAGAVHNPLVVNSLLHYSYG